MNPRLWWYVARAGGIAAWALAAASLLWGLLLSTRLFRRRPRPNWLLDLHRFLGGLAVVFTVVHMAALVADSYVDFGLRELLVPFASQWHPVAVAWGVVGFWLLLAVEATSLLMRRLPRRLWLAVHRASYALFVVATIHGLAAGSDGTRPIALWTVVLVCGAAVFLTLVRILSPRNRAAQERRRRIPQEPEAIPSQ